MNIFHIKYAIEVAKVGSINKASENLGMAQPNISRAIKDLEADFGITIFDRSAKGMTLTPEGREFVAQAQKILDQMNELERLYRGEHPGRDKLSVALPRAGYITDAVKQFVKTVDENAFEIVINEFSAERTIKSIIDSECSIGIIRCTDTTEALFTELFAEKHIISEVINSFEKLIVVSRDSVLSERASAGRDELIGLTEITDGDDSETTHAFEALRDELHDHGEKCIHISDHLTQIELISDNANYFMLSPKLSEDIKARYGLVEIGFSDSHTFKDILIYREGHKLSKLEKAFIDTLNGI